jgi:uncharacterized repeat protein (TIGR01451 family)
MNVIGVGEVISRSYGMTRKFSHAFCAAHFWLRLIASGLVAVGLLSLNISAHAAPPYGASVCAPTRYGSNLNCTANDVSINTITVASGAPATCVGGQQVNLDLDVTIQFGAPSRYNIGVFVANDGNDPKLLPSSGGASSCSVAVLPNSSPFLNLDGGNCGDGNGSISGGTGSGTFRMYSVGVPCTTDGSGNNTLYVPYLVSWDQSSNTNACWDNTYPAPGTTSKCNTGAVSFPAGSGIVVLPQLTITDGVTTVRTGGVLTYTVVITNATASTLNGVVFTDPAVAGLNISSVSCATAGATCPASFTVADMQGAGIALPSMPNNSSITFTVVGTYTGSPVSPTTLTNTANATVSGQTNTASDTDTVMVPPTVAKSFSPSSIAAGGTSTLTVTLTNPTTTVNITGAAFTDNYPAAMKNSGTPTLTNTCGGTATAAANGTSLSLSGATIPKGGSCSVSVQVTTTTSATNSTGAVTSSNAASGSSASATLSVIGSINGFNAFETSTAAGAITGVINTKIAGSAFSLDVVAISGGAQAGSFTNAVKVELLGNTVTGVALDAQNCPTSFTLLQTVAPNPTITAGRSTVNFSAVADAWKDVRVRISYPTAAPTVTACSTDNFAIRPVAFTITSNATNTNTSGTPTIKAGSSFNLTAASVAGYNGTPSIDNSKVVGSPTAGTLGGSFGAALVATGIATGSSFTYTEVGNFGLNANAVYDTSFTSVDQPSDCTADFSNALVGGKYGCKIGSNAVAMTTGVSGFGRFIPDHFGISAASITNRADLACAASTFTYMDEPMNALFTLTAQAAGNTATQNYSGVYAKFNPASDPLGFGAVDSTATPSYLSARLDTSVPASGSFALGVASVTAPLSITRGASPDGPYAALDIGLAPVDSDGVTMSAYDLDTDAVAGNDHTKIARTEARFGRLKLSNAHGSELLKLPIPIQTQYWNVNAFVTNTADSCTTLIPDNIKLTAVPGVAAVGGAFASGVGSLTLSPPSTAAKVAVDLCVDLGPDPGGGTACVATNPASLSYLQGLWAPGTSYNNDPGARATFGVYKGANEFIYERENY